MRVLDDPELFDVGPRLAGVLKRCIPAPSGTGPFGETCKNCALAVRHGRIIKCGVMRRHWTHGPATDIKAGWAACSQWKPREGYRPLELLPPGFPLAAAREEPLIVADQWEECGDTKGIYILDSENGSGIIR